MKSMREILLSFAIIAVCGLFLIVASLFGGGEKTNAIAAEIQNRLDQGAIPVPVEIHRQTGINKGTCQTEATVM
jgi:hypothetical protein